MSRSRTATGAGTIATAALVLLFGNQIVTEWIGKHANNPDNAFHLLLNQLAWPNWAIGTAAGESTRSLLARDLRAVLVIAIAALILAMMARAGSIGFVAGWAVLIFSSALAAFVTAFVIADPTFSDALRAAGAASSYGLFVGWIVGIVTATAKKSAS